MKLNLVLLLMAQTCMGMHFDDPSDPLTLTVPPSSLELSPHQNLQEIVLLKKLEKYFFSERDHTQDFTSHEQATQNAKLFSNLTAFINSHALNDSSTSTQVSDEDTHQSSDDSTYTYDENSSVTAASKHAKCNYKDVECKTTFSTQKHRDLFCHICQREYKPKKQLDLHRARMHGGTPDYVCTHKKCKAAYTTQSSLGVHIMRMHTKKKFKCSECTRRFAVRGDLNQHLKRSHKIALKT